MLSDGLGRKVMRTTLRENVARHDEHAAVELLGTYGGTSVPRKLTEATDADEINAVVNVPPGFRTG